MLRVWNCVWDFSFEIVFRCSAGSHRPHQIMIMTTVIIIINKFLFIKRMNVINKGEGKWKRVSLLLESVGSG